MADTLVKKRLYVGGLAENISEDELKDRFARFVSVANLTLKCRTDSEGNHIKSFAHLDVQGSEESIKKCFSAYQNAKWKGSVMKLQDAKEDFLERLETERQDLKKESEKSKVPEKKETKEWKPPEFCTVSGAAVPGTPIPGKKDWVVGKYGRVLPILNVKKSYKTKVVKHDPSKFCHASKVFKDGKDDTSFTETRCDKLTWEIDTPDSEITKKRKGEFLPSSSPKKAKPFPFHLLSNDNNFPVSHQKNDLMKNRRNDSDLEIVKIGQGALVKNAAKPARSKFDSDYESDGDDELVALPSYVNAPKVDSLKSAQKPDKNSKAMNPMNSSVMEKAKVSRNDGVGTLNKKGSIPEFRGIGSLVTITAGGVSDSKKCVKPVEKVGESKGNNSKKKRKSSTSELSSSHQSEDEDEKSDEENAVNDVEEIGDDEEVSSDDEEEVSSGDEKEDSSGNEKEVSSGDEKEVSSVDEEEVSSGDEKEVSSGDEKEDSSGDEKEVSSDDEEEDSSNDEEEDSSDDEEEDSSDEEEEDSSDDEEKDDKGVAVSEERNDVKSAMKSKTKTPQPLKETTELSPLNGLSPKSSQSSCENSPSSTNPGPSSLKLVTSISKSDLVPKNSIRRTNVDLSEFVAEVPDTTRPGSHSSDNSDSHDSDLDSNDFRLVAKKLALKAKEKSSGSKSFPSENNRDYEARKSKENNRDYEARKSKENNRDYEARNSKENNRSYETRKSKENEKKRTFDEIENIENCGAKQKLRKTDCEDSSSVRGVSTVQNKLVSLANDDSKSEQNVLDTSVTPPDQNPSQQVTMSKQEADNAKRLQAVKEQIQIRQRKKDLMKSAMRNVDTVSTKRIVFSSSEEDDDEDDKKDNSVKIIGTEAKDKPVLGDVDKASGSKMTLLGESSDGESEEEDVEEMFKSKPQFEGKKGEKLMKMQKKFGDSRFKLDAKFIESDDSDEDDEENLIDDQQDTKQMKKPDEEVSLADERKRNLEVLENVVGKQKVDRLAAKLKRDNIKIVDMNKLRFDPSKLKPVQPTQEAKVKPGDDSKKPQAKEKTTKSSQKEEEKEEDEPVESVVPTQEASKSKVTLSDSLVDMLRTKGKTEEGKTGGTGTSFSLQDMFNDVADDDDEDEEEMLSPQKPLTVFLTSKNNKDNEKVTEKPVTNMEVSDSEGEEAMEVETEKQKKKLKPGSKTLLNLRGNESNEEENDSDDDGDDIDDEKNDKTSRLESIQTSFNPVRAREKALKDAGRVDVRFTKEEWQERFSEIRHDLLLMCKKRYKDARRKKRIEDEHNRKKAVLKKAGKGGWWRKK